MFISLIILSSAISLYILSKALQEFAVLFSSFHLPDLGNKEKCGVEVPVVETAKPRYDVEGFKKRMAVMRDENGLYDVTPPTPVTDFTGAEIITKQAELDIDKYVGRA